MTDSPTATGLPIEARYHHLHLASTDAAASAAWYARHLGGRAVTNSRYELCQFEGQPKANRRDHFLIWTQSDEVKPSVGSVIDHLAWSVASIEPVLEAMIEDGASLEMEPTTVGPEDLQIAFVTDPWGAKLELLCDEDHLGFHHIHLLAPDIEEHRDWLQSRIGGTALQFKGMLQGLYLGDLWLLYREATTPLAASKGHAIDHLGLLVDHVEARTRALTEGRRQSGGAPSRRCESASLFRHRLPGSSLRAGGDPAPSFMSARRKRIFAGNLPWTWATGNAGQTIRALWRGALGHPAARP